MNISFDLRTQPWIPCLNARGQTEELSLTKTLAQSHHLTELACASPLQTAAILRLLLAVLYRATQIRSKADWISLWEQPTLPLERIAAYLNAQDGMNLFGPKPFGQVAGMTMTNSVPLSALATEMATGNNGTLFDHRTDDAPVGYTPAQATRMVTTAQAFALGFGKAAEATVNLEAWPRPYLADAIALRGVTLFLSGRTLRETLLLNLVPHDDVQDQDWPFWEQAVPMALLDKVGADGKRIGKLARGVVDRYAWQSRMMRLLPDDDGLVRNVYLTQGREADKSPGDPMKVFVQGKKEEGLYALNLNAGKAAWRDVQSYLGAGKAYNTSIFNHIGGLVFVPGFDEDAPLDPSMRYGLNIIGLATDPGKAGKFLLWRHDRVSLPAALLASDELRGWLETGLGEAEETAVNLGARLRLVISRFLPPDGNPAPDDVKKMANALDPRPAFWARLETHFGHFVGALGSTETAQTGLEEWRGDVEREAERALREACRQLGHSPRALKATAAVTFGFIADPARRAELAEERKKAKTTKGATK